MTQYLITDSDAIYKLTVEGDPRSCASKVTLAYMQDGVPQSPVSLQLGEGGKLNYVDPRGRTMQLELGDAYDIYLMMTYLIRHTRLAGKAQWYKLDCTAAEGDEE